MVRLDAWRSGGCAAGGCRGFKDIGTGGELSELVAGVENQLGNCCQQVSAGQVRLCMIGITLETSSRVQVAYRCIR